MILKSGQRWHDPYRKYVCSIDRDTVVEMKGEAINLKFMFKYYCIEGWYSGGFHYERFLPEGDMKLLSGQEAPEEIC